MPQQSDLLSHNRWSEALAQLNELKRRTDALLELSTQCNQRDPTLRLRDFARELNERRPRVALVAEFPADLESIAAWMGEETIYPGGCDVSCHLAEEGFLAASSANEERFKNADSIVLAARAGGALFGDLPELGTDRQAKSIVALAPTAGLDDGSIVATLSNSLPAAVICRITPSDRGELKAALETQWITGVISPLCESATVLTAVTPRVGAAADLYARLLELPQADGERLVQFARNDIAGLKSLGDELGKLLTRKYQEAIARVDKATNGILVEMVKKTAYEVDSAAVDLDERTRRGRVASDVYTRARNKALAYFTDRTNSALTEAGAAISQALVEVDQLRQSAQLRWEDIRDGVLGPELVSEWLSAPDFTATSFTVTIPFPHELLAKASSVKPEYVHDGAMQAAAFAKSIFMYALKDSLSIVWAQESPETALNAMLRHAVEARLAPAQNGLLGEMQRAAAGLDKLLAETHLERLTCLDNDALKSSLAHYFRNAKEKIEMEASL